MPRSAFVERLKIIVPFLLVLFSFGCTHYYVPAVYPLKEEMVTGLEGKSAVSLVNSQETPGAGGKEELIGSLGVHTWYGDLQKWTDTAIELTRSELENRGFTVSGGQSKVLKLAIARANVYQGAFQIRCILYLHVETGDGYKNEFEGNNASGWTLYRACDGAVTRAVAAMLNDETVRAYLQY